MVEHLHIKQLVSPIFLILCDVIKSIESFNKLVVCVLPTLGIDPNTLVDP